MTMTLFILLLVFASLCVGWIFYFKHLKRLNKTRRFWLHTMMLVLFLVGFGVQSLCSINGWVDHYFILMGALVGITAIPLLDQRDQVMRATFGFMAGFMMLVLFNFVGSFAHFSIDLTEEQRHTLNPLTEEMLKDLDDIVYVEVYLEGDFSAPYKRLQASIKDKLNSLRAVAEGKIEYVFIDPAESDNEEEVLNVYDQLQRKGMLYATERSGVAETGARFVWHGAILRYRDQELVVNFIDGQEGPTLDAVVDQAISDLEYSLSNTIRKFTIVNPKKIGFLQGHGELPTINTIDYRMALGEYYATEAVKIEGRFDALDDFDALVIAKPDSTFSEQDKFVIDQFVMKGGKVLWLVDPTNATMDSLKASNTPTMTMAMARPLNIEDQLFRYGVRLNNNLVMDKKCAQIPLPADVIGRQALNRPYDWYYSPVINPITEHAITRNVDNIRLDFASTIDTVGNPEVKKTVLLHSSKLSRVMNAPVRLSLRTATIPYEDAQFNKPFRPVAVLLEGEFESAFMNFMPEAIYDVEGLNPKEKSVDNKMIVIADGDIVRNFGDAQTERFLPLGYDPDNPSVVYRNKVFLLNCMNYLLDDGGLMSVRSLEPASRLLDSTKVAEDQGFWKFMNVALPILLILAFAGLQHLVRRRAATADPFLVKAWAYYLILGLLPTVSIVILLLLFGPVLGLVLGLFLSFWWLGTTRMLLAVKS